MSHFLLAAAALLSLNSCATTGSTNSNEWCCLVDPGHGALLMPNTKTSKVALENWVSQHAGHLTTSGGAKPRFVLMYVGKDMRIKDQMPLADQISPTAPHKLSAAEVNALRACFQGGKPVKIDWANKRVIQ
jgi:hypothetical protein